MHITSVGRLTLSITGDHHTSLRNDLYTPDANYLYTHQVYIAHVIKASQN